MESLSKILLLKEAIADYLVKEHLNSESIEKAFRQYFDQSKLLQKLKEEVSMRLELESELKKEKEQNEIKSKFITLASHEFRTPLTTILSSSYLIEKNLMPTENDKILKHINRIKSSVQNLIGVLEDFLSLNKLEEGEFIIKSDFFELGSFLGETIEEVFSLKKEGQEFVYDNEKDCLIVCLDKQILKNILLNLLSNALKYSAEGKKIYISTDHHDDKLIISIRDEGIGIPEADQKHIFSRFFRANNSKCAQGTGLGLNIVKRYVEIMGGSIDFVSEINKGTIFIVMLPLQLPQTSSSITNLNTRDT